MLVFRFIGFSVKLFFFEPPIRKVKRRCSPSHQYTAGGCPVRNRWVLVLPLYQYTIAIAVVVAVVSLLKIEFVLMHD